MDNARMLQIKELMLQEPGDSFLHYALAIEYVGIGNDDEAIRIFHQLASTDPGYVATYYHWAQALLRKGSRDEAMDVMQKGIAIARQAGNRHALSELQSAYNEVVYDAD